MRIDKLRNGEASVSEIPKQQLSKMFYEDDLKKILSQKESADFEEYDEIFRAVIEHNKQKWIKTPMGELEVKNFLQHYFFNEQNQAYFSNEQINQYHVLDKKIKQIILYMKKSGVLKKRGSIGIITGYVLYDGEDN